MTTSPALLKNLLAVLEEIATPGLAEAWDNVGVMVGDPGQEITGVLVALDPTEEVLAEAENHGCNVVVTHHPLIFKPLQSIRTDQVSGRLLARVLQGKLAVIGCHTNLDKVAGGVSDVLAARLGLRNCRVLAADPGGEPGSGFGRVGETVEPVDFRDFAQLLMTMMSLPALRVAGVAPGHLSTVAVCGGSASELAPAAMEAGAQVFVTGEVKHSTARWAEDAGFCIIDAGHYATEVLVVPELVAAIAGGLEGMGFKVPIRIAESQRSPFQYYFR